MTKAQRSWQDIRADFPILNSQMQGQPLVYLDNAATSQKPQEVLDALLRYYQSHNANVHRGAYTLSQQATDLYEGVRQKVAHWLGIKKTQEVIYTSGTTHGINLVCQGWGRKTINSGDEILVTRMEHHSNFVPWQQLANEKGAHFRIIECDKNFQLDLDHLEDTLQKAQGRAKILAITWQSNVLGTSNPIAEISVMAKKYGAHVLVDAAQAVAHLPIQLTTFPAVDFLVLSSHKICGATGSGILWGREELLNSMDPVFFGGDMILSVTDTATQWNSLPWKFEAGTPAIASVIAMGAAVDYLMKIGMQNIYEHEQALIRFALNKIQRLPFLQLFGPGAVEDRGTALSFVMENLHPHDIATYLDSKGIAVRAGHHCAQPLVQHYGHAATTRASLAFYNNQEEISFFTDALSEMNDFFTRKGKGGRRV